MISIRQLHNKLITKQAAQTKSLQSTVNWQADGCSSSRHLLHGLLPVSMQSVVLVPVIKDKTGEVGSMDYHRPIARASVLSKVLKSILLDKLSVYVCTSENQFGFKAKHGTDLCIYELKEMVEKYRRQNSSVLIRFIDASMAFDHINHYILFLKLSQRGVPDSVIRILVYGYANQSMHIKWGNAVSTPFGVSNGVRKGGYYHLGYSIST